MALQQTAEDKRIYNAMQVSTTTQDWTVIVQVVQKHKAELAKNKITRYKKYVLTDMEGTRIRAVTFNSNIEPLEKLLIPFKRCQISNADLNLANPQYRIGDYTFEWVLTTNHLIQEIQMKPLTVYRAHLILLSSPSCLNMQNTMNTLMSKH